MKRQTSLFLLTLTPAIAVAILGCNATETPNKSTENNSIIQTTTNSTESSSKETNSSSTTGSNNKETTTMPTVPEQEEESDDQYIDLMSEYYETIANYAKEGAESAKLYVNKTLYSNILSEDIPLVQALSGMSVAYTAKAARKEIAEGRYSSITVKHNGVTYREIDIDFTYSGTELSALNANDYFERFQWALDQKLEHFTMYQTSYDSDDFEPIANKLHEYENKNRAIKYYSQSYREDYAKYKYRTEFHFIYPDSNDIVTNDISEAKQLISEWYEGTRENGVTFYIPTNGGGANWLEKTTQYYQDWFKGKYPDSEYTPYISKLKTHPDDKYPENKDIYVVCEINTSNNGESSSIQTGQQDSVTQPTMLTWEPITIKEADKYIYDFEQKLSIETKPVTKSEEELVTEVINSIIKPGMSELEKVKAIHDYMILNMEYDYPGYLLNNIDSEDNTVAGALTNGNTVCQGYAVTFEALCKKSGIECVYVSGFVLSGEAHAWNQVKVDGNWYNIDVTWDDASTTFGLESDNALANYDYFLISDEYMSEDHMPETEVNACTAESISYDVLKYGYSWPGLYVVTSADEAENAAYKASSEDLTHVIIVYKQGVFESKQELTNCILRGISKNSYSADILRTNEEIHDKYIKYIFEFDTDYDKLIKTPQAENKEELFEILNESASAGKDSINVYVKDYETLDVFLNEYNKGHLPTTVSEVSCNTYLTFDGDYIDALVHITYKEE